LINDDNDFVELALNSCGFGGGRNKDACKAEAR